jgi:alpha-glucosidase (family GH31 glycosyl hydrolase)
MLSLTPGIEKAPSPSYSRGEDMNVFLLNPLNESLVLHTPSQNLSFVDFFHPNASLYWCEMLDFLNGQMAFDGIWLEGNEATVDQKQTTPSFPETSFEAPFTPDGISLDYNMLPLRTQHYGGGLKTEFNTHSLYGSMSARTTAECIAKSKSTRPFVISQSTRAGDGKYMGHILSGLQGTWEHLRASLVTVFTYQLFGLAQSGADVCGYTLDASDELCTRWMQLAAWFPLLRNHHSKEVRSQSIYSYPKDAQNTMKNAIQLRYSLSSYLYSLHFIVAIKGGSVFKPLFFEFPHDEGVIRDDQHVMIGPALFFTPIMTESVHESVMSLPSNSIWYNYFTGEKTIGRENLRFFTALDSISLLIKAGNAVTYQDAAGVLTIEDMRNKSIGVLFALDDQRQAKGELYLDDGISPDSIKSKRYSHVSFRAFKEEFSLVIESSPKYQGYKAQIRLTEVKVYGLHLRVVEEVTVSSAVPTDLTRIHSFAYNEAKGTLVITVDLDLTTLHRIRIS